MFLSHSIKDDQFVRELGAFLEREGEIKTWVDHHHIEKRASRSTRPMSLSTGLRGANAS